MLFKSSHVLRDIIIEIFVKVDDFYKEIPPLLDELVTKEHPI